MLVTLSTRPQNGQKASVVRTVDTKDEVLMGSLSKADPYIQVVKGRFDTYLIDWREVLSVARSL